MSLAHPNDFAQFEAERQNSRAKSADNNFSWRRRVIRSWSLIIKFSQHWRIAMVGEKDRKDVLGRIQRDELAQLTKELVDIPSPTGSEKAMGEFILNWYSRHGIKPVRQEIDPNRINAVGILKGSGDGVSLMINGHMDTSYTGTDEDKMFCRELEPDNDLKGAIRDGKVFGLGAS